jgi:hypothetical protein
VNIRAIFGRRGAAIPPEKLPQLHAFVDVLVGGRAAQRAVVERIDERGLLIAGVLGRLGEAATIIYTTPSGRFKAQTRVASVEDLNTIFAPLSNVGLVGASTNGEQKRQNVRMDTLVQGAWRFAPGGKGSGEFTRCSINDISRGGCSVILDRELRYGALIEVRLDLRSGTMPLELLAEVMRHQVIPKSGKHSHGVRFHGVRPSEDQAITEFIYRRQSDLRNRGLA